jgi:arginyl-tRNA synthetase
MTSVVNYLSASFAQAFINLQLSPEYGKVVVSDRQDLGQFQCNGALLAAKVAAQNPRILAQNIIEQITTITGEIFASLSIAGPGFINIILKDEIIAKFILEMYAAPNLGVGALGSNTTVMLDYGGPNVAKAMHVGHLRSAIIGESLKRAYKFVGFKTISDIHLGDWGTQMGMVISELALKQPNLPYFQEPSTSFPSTPPLSISDLEEIYPQASQNCKNDPLRLELAKAATVKLQHGHPGYRALWQHLIDVSVAQIRNNYQALNVTFDLWDGESTVHEQIAPLVAKLLSQGIAEHSNGATVIHVQVESDHITVPPLILYKQDGAVMYGTTDLATIDARVQMYKPAKIIYIVDKRQQLHFEQVFRATRKCALAAQELELIFVGHGTMNGLDGKPFKTRAGGVMRLDELINSSLDKAIARMADANIASDLAIAHAIAISAIKFADLQNNPTSDYVFDLDRMISFEGKTGPYLLYQAVRIKSLLDKAQAIAVAKQDLVFASTQDQSLALYVLNFEQAIHNVVLFNTPHVLADYLYKLAQMFSSFYASCPILSETNIAIQATRLLLATLTLQQLMIGLDILGITIPNKM